MREHVAITDPDTALRAFPVSIEQGTYVTDITHYLDDQGEVSAEMPREARQLASFLVLVIDAASRNVPSDNQDILLPDAPTW